MDGRKKTKALTGIDMKPNHNNRTATHKVAKQWASLATNSNEES